MTSRIPITIRVDSFEGPLDLLLYLIQSHELDISNVSISKITDQYLSYVLQMQELNFDIASEFLVMAATLLYWKSKSLLPQEEKPSDEAEQDGMPTQEDLIKQLLEHQRFLAAGQDLAQMPRLGEDVFTRPNRRPPIERVWKTMDLSQLALSYQDQLVRARKRTQVLKKETVSLTDKMLEFGDRLTVGKPTGMSKVLSAVPTRPEIVVTFLASLELSRLKKMRLHQQVVYEEIFMELLESLKNFNFSLATGFEYDLQNPAPAPVSATDTAATGLTHSIEGPNAATLDESFSSEISTS